MDLKETSELLKELLVKFYKIPETEVDSLTNESAKKADTLAAITEKDAQRVQKIKEPLVGKFDEGKNAGKKEALTALEKELKTKYGIDSDAQGLELIDAVVTAKSGGAEKTITEDDVKKHPAYQSAEKAFKQQLKATATEWETKLTEREKQFGRQQTLSTVGKRALETLGTMNPIMPGNPKVAANLQNAFMKQFEDYDYDIQDNGKNIVIMKDGKVIDDGHGHSMDFEKLVKDKAADYFEFKQNNGGGNAGNGGTGGTGGTGGGTGYPAGIVKPKTFEEVVKIVDDTTIKAEDRAIVLQTWEAEQKAGTA